MRNSFVLILIFAVFVICTFGQNGPAPKQTAPEKSIGATSAATPLDLAKATLAAHGGDKLKKMKSLVLKGSATLSFNGQDMPGAFSTVVSGEKYYFEIISAVQQLKQTFDGTQTYSSIPGISLPPVTSLGFPLLPKIGDAGYVIAALPDGGKKRNGFRLTTPEGFYTDFIVNEKTGQIKSYESKWMVSDRPITTSVEIDEFQTVEGLVVPKKYSQRFDLGPITAYANFNTKTVLINSAIEDAAFIIPK